MREALVEPLEDAASTLKSGGTNDDIGEVSAFGGERPWIQQDPVAWDPMRPTPYDVDAT